MAIAGSVRKCAGDGRFQVCYFRCEASGAIAVALITLAELSKPDPEQKLAPSHVARGERGVQITSLVLSPITGRIATTNMAGRAALRHPVPTAKSSESSTSRDTPGKSHFLPMAGPSPPWDLLRAFVCGT